MALPFLAVTGHFRSGKDTVADYLVAHYGYTKTAFAKPLKRTLAMALIREFQPGSVYADGTIDPLAITDLLAYIEAHKWDDPSGPTSWCRQGLQAWGIAGRALADADHWVRQALAGDGIVIADLRFPNEEAFVHSHAGYVVRLSRLGAAGDRHASENQIAALHADVEVENNGSLADLYAQIDRIVEAYR